MTDKKKPDERREEIFRAALTCFNRTGYHKTSIEDIAAATGISKGAIYYHFKSKKNLFVELYKSRVNSYFDEVTVTLSSSAKAPDRLLSLLQRSEEVFQRHVDVLKFLLEFVTMASRDPEIRSEVTLTYRNRVKTFGKLIQEGIEEGTFRDMDAENISRVLFFLSMGFFLTCFTVNPDFDPVKLHRVSMETVFKGIQNP